MESAPELSIRSGGLPPRNRGCNSVAIWVDGATLIVRLGWFAFMMFWANST